jgi:hypothetical protein
MSVETVQECLARMYVDRHFRDWFWVASSAQLATLQLTDEEVALLQALDRRLVEVLAASVRQKRRERLHASYPGVVGLDVPRVERLTERFLDEVCPHPGWPAGEEARRFGMFLLNGLVDDAPWYAADLIGYERLLVRLPRVGIDTDAEPAEIGMDCRPILAEGVAVRRFGCDVVGLRAVLRNGDKPDHVAPAEVWVAVDSARSRPFTLGALAAGLLRRCDGTRTVAQLIAEAAGPRDPEGADAIWHALATAQSNRLIAVDPPAGT